MKTSISSQAPETGAPARAKWSSTDIIAVEVGFDQRQIVVAARGYMAAAETSLHPRDLTQHRCIGWRSSADVAPSRWEFAKDVRELAVAVDREVTTDGIDLMVGMAPCWRMPDGRYGRDVRAAVGE